MPDELHGKPGEILRVLAFSAFFGGCGLLMAWNLLSGEAEFVHGPRTHHPLVTILGENVFMSLSTLVCLLFGAGGFYVVFASLRASYTFKQAEEAALEEKTPTAKARGARAKAKREKERDAKAGGSITLDCLHCGMTSRIPAAYAGREGLCPKCKGEVRVPEARGESGAS